MTDVLQALNDALVAGHIEQSDVDRLLEIGNLETVRWELWTIYRGFRIVAGDPE